MCNGFKFKSNLLSIGSHKNLRSIGCLSLAVKYVFKDIIDKTNSNLLFRRSIYTEIPKHKSNNTNGRQTLNNRQNRSKLQTNYDKLGITPKATQKQIKSAYFSLSKTCHPDVNNSSEAALQFRDITDAYDVLSNKESKRLYDSTIGNHFHRQKPSNSIDINQENLDNYRSFGKFRNNFGDNEEYLNNKWKKRRTIRKENIYKEENESNKRRGYEDPLRYDPKEYFKDHFNEEMQREYAEQIDKRNKEMEVVVQEMRYQNSIKLIIVLTIIIMIPLTLQMMDYSFELSQPSNKKTNGDSKTKSN